MHFGDIRVPPETHSLCLAGASLQSTRFGEVTVSGDAMADRPMYVFVSGEMVERPCRASALMLGSGVYITVILRVYIP
jgi:hypothetical protein